MLKTRTWIIIIAAAAVVLAALTAVTLNLKRDSAVVEVVQDGTVIRQIDLNAVAREYSFDVFWRDGGVNTVTVRPGRICVSHADCPDLVCVNRGWLSTEVTPIVCMPHRLVIRAAGATELDAVSE